jgi:hypothetical protein
MAQRIAVGWEGARNSRLTPTARRAAAIVELQWAAVVLNMEMPRSDASACGSDRYKPKATAALEGRSTTKPAAAIVELH